MVSQERELFPEGGLRAREGAGIVFRGGCERELQEKEGKHFVENLFPGQEENALRKCGHKSREEMFDGWPFTFSSSS